MGGVAICADCLAALGSCCAKFDGNDLTADADPERRENASPVCYAPLFEEEDSRETPDTVWHDVSRRWFHIGACAHLDYELPATNKLNVIHTLVPENQRGNGLGACLMDAVVDYAQREKL